MATLKLSKKDPNQKFDLTKLPNYDGLCKEVEKLLDQANTMGRVATRHRFELYPEGEVYLSQEVGHYSRKIETTLYVDVYFKCLDCPAIKKNPLQWTGKYWYRSGTGIISNSGIHTGSSSNIKNKLLKK